MVARGIVFSGFATLPDGMVAHSKPRNAKNVKVAVAVIALKSELLLVLNGTKFSDLKKNKPPMATNSNGIIFKMVVTNCSFPDVTMPMVLIHVSNHMEPK